MLADCPLVSLRALYSLLGRTFDASSWWPAQSRYEIVVGAILTQNTSWSNVEKAIAALRAAGKLTPDAVLSIPPGQLEGLIRPCGYYRTKACYLVEATRWFVANDAEAAAVPTPLLRADLLKVKGVGSETADALLLYVYDRPVFIYDLYARRLLGAAGFGEFSSYEQARRLLDSQVQAAGFSVAELADFHGLIVEGGKVASKAGGWDKLLPRLYGPSAQRPSG